MKKPSKKISETQKAAVLAVLAALEQKFPGDRDAQSAWIIARVERECAN